MCASNPIPTEPVSVIIPTFNRRELLGRAIDSVLSQTYEPFELLVVDDGSDDGTDVLVASYGNKVRYLYQDNRGAAAARNTGIKAATTISGNNGSNSCARESGTFLRAFDRIVPPCALSSQR